MSQRIWVAGHGGMVGSALTRLLRREGETVLTVERRDLDLRDQTAVSSWIGRNRPDAIVCTAAKVGGILANDTLPAEFIHDNLAIATNVIHGAHLAGVDRLAFLGSSCVYPKHAEQPIREEALLSGPLEPTNEWYAVAKIASMKMCQAYRKQYGRRYISIMPCNLYGEGDNFDLDTSHVLPALMRKFHQAKVEERSSVVIWGTGTPLREFMHVDDLARGIVFCLKNYDGSDIINCGSGSEIAIRDLAARVGDIVGFTGEISYDASKPDGTPRKLMDSRRIRELGWSPVIGLEEGIRSTYEWFLSHGSVEPKGAGR